MIDLHSHILPGLDDGVATIEEARELARAAVAEGVTAIAATPHVRHDYPTTPDRMEAGVAELRTDFAEQGIPLEVLHGGELDLDFLTGLDDDELRRFSLGQTGRYLLLESPYTGWPLGLEALVFDLRVRGFSPILAHPERNPEVQARPERLRALVEAGTLLQVTAGSLDGRLGRPARTAAAALIGSGLAGLVASDAHAPSVRAFGLEAARTAVGDDGLAGYLFRDVPTAIAAGADPPARPVVRPRRRLGFRVLRR